MLTDWLHDPTSLPIEKWKHTSTQVMKNMETLHVFNTPFRLNYLHRYLPTLLPALPFYWAIASLRYRGTISYFTNSSLGLSKEKAEFTAYPCLPPMRLRQEDCGWGQPGLPSPKQTNYQHVHCNAVPECSWMQQCEVICRGQDHWAHLLSSWTMEVSLWPRITICCSFSCLATCQEKNNFEHHTHLSP